MILLYIPKRQLFSILFLLTLMSIALPCSAHKLNVFAYEENGTIICETSFSGGRPAKNSPVKVSVTSGKTILEGSTDQKGMFRFPLPKNILQKPEDITITVAAGDGHIGSWVVEAGDYAHISEPASAPVSQPSSLSPSIATSVCDESCIRRIVAEELTPVKKVLAEEKVRPVTLQDILGGIGYILGLAGLAAYIQFKKSGEKK